MRNQFELRNIDPPQFPNDGVDQASTYPQYRSRYAAMFRCPSSTRVYDAQLLTYLRLSGVERGLMINWFSSPLINGIKRMVRTLPEPAG
jgi:hypothetical protein